MICRIQRIEIGSAHRSFCHKVRRPPREFWTAQLHHEYIRDQASVPAIAVRERMDERERMVEPDGNLVGWMSPMLNPVAHIAE